MIKEVKYFINKLRGVVLNEGVSTSRIVDAINKRKYLYIYYEGDDTVMKGYRIIKPYVLGVTTAGNTAIRAWESEGGSDTFYGVGVDKRRRKDHEYFDGMEGEKPSIPGWRLFLVDDISKLYPTGKTFTGFPPLYNPNDKGMISIQAAIPMGDEKVTTTGIGDTTEPDIIKQQGQKKKVVKQDVEDYYDVVRKVKKRRPDEYAVYYNENGEITLGTERQAERIPKEDYVGNLKDLYNKMVLPTKRIDTSFHKKKRDDFLGEFDY